MKIGGENGANGDGFQLNHYIYFFIFFYLVCFYNHFHHFHYI
jgi:hypothetical protein